MKLYLLGYVVAMLSVALAPAAEVKIEFADLSAKKQQEMRDAGYTAFSTTLPSLKKGELVQFDALRSLFQPPPTLLMDPYRPYWTQPLNTLLTSGCIGGACQRR